MDNILEHPLLKNVQLDRAVNYAVELIRIVGMPAIFQDKTEIIEVEDYRAKLPCDFYEITAVKSTDGTCYRSTTDVFCPVKKDDREYDATYKIQNSVIILSRKHDCIEVSYKSMLLDEDGFPLIPDNQSFIKALEWYIKREVFTMLFDINRVSAQALTNAEQKYAWYVGQAQSDLVRPTIDQMESIANILTQRINRINEHASGFKYLGTREYTKKH